MYKIQLYIYIKQFLKVFNVSQKTIRYWFTLFSAISFIIIEKIKESQSLLGKTKVSHINTMKQYAATITELQSI